MLQGFLDGQNALMANLAGNMLQQQGASYIQKGQAFMQSKMGFLSSSLLQYLFNVGSSYGATHAVRDPLRSCSAAGMADWVPCAQCQPSCSCC